VNSEKDLPYVITPAAMADLKAIAQQTITRWNENQATIYSQKLDSCFEKIAKRSQSIEKPFSKRFPQLEYLKCEHHYIFFIRKNLPKPVIVAVLYEHMDIVTRLSKRLTKS